MMLEERVMRVTAALYRVTDLFSDKEPIKWKLRTDALAFIEAISMEKPSIEYALGVCRNVRSKLAVAKAGGFMSRINFHVLEKEYLFISEILSDILKKIEQNTEKDITDIYIGQNIFRDVHKKRNLEADSPNGVGVSERKKEDSEPSSTDERHSVILAILRERGWISASEITVLYGKDINPKMIQRDLNALIRAGAIHGKGERRWRKYAISSDSQ
jgi:predicted transcriptional regulator